MLLVKFNNAWRGRITDKHLCATLMGCHAAFSKRYLAIAGSAAGVAGWVTSVSQSIDPLVQFSRETGVAIETVQTLGYAASVNGSSVDALQASLGEMTKRVGEFVSTGEGEAKDVAGRLGLQFKDMNGQVKNSDVIFRELADKLHGMSQAEKFSVLDKMGKRSVRHWY